MSSVGDAEALLAFGSPILQTQGFADLLTLLQTTKDFKERKSALELFWKCLLSPSKLVCSLAIMAIPKLVASNVVSQDDVLNECLMSLSRTCNIREILRLAFQLSGGFSKSLLSFYRQIPSEKKRDFVAQLKDLDLQRMFPCLLRLVLGGELGECERLDLLAHILSKGDLEMIITTLDCLDDHIPSDAILICAQSVERSKLILGSVGAFSGECLTSMNLSFPSCLFLLATQLGSGDLNQSLYLLQNPTFPSHPILVAPLTSMYSAISELTRRESMPRILPDKAEEYVKTAMTRCQSSDYPEGIEDWKESDISFCLSSLLTWIILSDARLTSYTQFWLENKCTSVTREAVYFAAGLLSNAKSSSMETCLELLVYLGRTDSSLANEIILLILPLYMRPEIKDLRSLVLGAISQLTTNRLAVASVLKFLLAVAHQERIEDRKTAIKLIGDIWSQHEEILDSIQALTKIDQFNDPIDIQRAKMGLVRRICQQSDRADEFLAMLSSLINEDGPLVPETILAIADLSRSEVIDVSVMLQQLGSKVLCSENDDTVVSYCDLLSTAAAETENEELLGSCVKQLWSLKGHRCSKVRIAAWKALSSFDLDTIKKLFSIDKHAKAEDSGAKCLEIITCAQSVSDDEASAFSCFLHRMIAIDLENIGRTPYSIQEKTSKPLEPLMETIMVAKDQLEKIGGVHLLTLTDYVASTVNPMSKRASYCNSLLLRLLTQSKISLSDDWIPSVRYISAWKVAISAFHRILCVAKQNQSGRPAPPNWARDQIAEMMKRALTQTHVAQMNVVISLPFLLEANLKYNDGKLDQGWITSTLEYLLSCSDCQYKAHSPLLFSQRIHHEGGYQALARLAAALIVRRIDDDILSFFEVPPSSVLIDNTDRKPHWLRKWTNSIITEDYLLGPEENDCLNDSMIDRITSHLLRLTPVDSQILDCIQSRSHIFLLNSILEGDPVIANSLIDRMRVDDSVEERFLHLLEGTGLSNDDCSCLYELYCELDEAAQRSFATKLSRKTKNLLNDSKRVLCVINGVCWCRLTSAVYNCVEIPDNYKALPENSVFKAVIDSLKSNIWKSRPKMVEALIRSLIGHIRKSDGRGLPPIDWWFLSGYMKPDNPALDEAIFHLAVEVGASRLLNKVLSSDRPENLPISLALAVAEQLPILEKTIPSLQMCIIVGLLFEIAEKNEWNENILRGLSAVSNCCPAVVKIWVRKAPPISSFCSILHPLYRLFTNADLSRIVHCTDPLSELWFCTRIMSNAHLENIIQIFCNINSDEESAAASLILTYHMLQLDNERRIDFLLELVTRFRVGKQKAYSSNSDALIHFRMFVALCVSERSYPIPVPLCSDAAADTWIRIEQRTIDHFRFLLRTENFNTNLSKVSLFLIELLQDLSGKGIDDMAVLRCRNIIKGLLRAAICIKPNDIIKLIEEAKIWDKVLSSSQSDEFF